MMPKTMAGTNKFSWKVCMQCPTLKFCHGRQICSKPASWTQLITQMHISLIWIKIWLQMIIIWFYIQWPAYSEDPLEKFEWNHCKRKGFSSLILKTASLCDKKSFSSWIPKTLRNCDKKGFSSWILKTASLCDKKSFSSWIPKTLRNCDKKGFSSWILKTVSHCDKKSFSSWILKTVNQRDTVFGCLYSTVSHFEMFSIKVKSKNKWSKCSNDLYLLYLQNFFTVITLT